MVGLLRIGTARWGLVVERTSQRMVLWFDVVNPETTRLGCERGWGAPEAAAQHRRLKKTTIHRFVGRAGNG